MDLNHTRLPVPPPEHLIPFRFSSIVLEHVIIYHSFSTFQVIILKFLHFFQKNRFFSLNEPEIHGKSLRICRRKGVFQLFAAPFHLFRGPCRSHFAAIPEFQLLFLGLEA